MDRERYRSRARRCHEVAGQIVKLSEMPDRVTKGDLSIAVEAMTNAGNAIDELLKATPPGCTCRKIEDVDYSRVIYDEKCHHHAALLHREKQLEEHYKKAERALKDEVRLRLVAAALSGAAGQHRAIKAEGSLVDRAIAIADEAIRQLTESPDERNPFGDDKSPFGRSE